jgi:hypothetical protein
MNAGLVSGLHSPAHGMDSLDYTNLKWRAAKKNSLAAERAHQVASIHRNLSNSTSGAIL